MSNKGLSFVKAFKTRVYDEYDCFLEGIYNKHSRKYTDVIKHIVISLISEAGSKNNSEFFKIDYTGWKSTDCDNVNGIHIYDRNLDFAVEHENDPTDWTNKLLKLNFVRADVKIVIGYVDNNQRDNELEIINTQSGKFRYSVEDNEEFYVVLMNTKLAQKGDPFCLKAYCIKNRTAKKIDV